MRCSCDISDGQPAAAGMGITVHNAPSSDGEAQNWALLASGEGGGNTKLQTEWATEGEGKLWNWKLTANAFTIIRAPLEGGPRLPLAPGVGLSPSVSMGLCKDNASDFSPKHHPWAGGGSRGRRQTPELAQTVFCGL